MPKAQTVIIAVAGGSGSGKTTVANAIMDHVGGHNIAYVPHDAYYKDLTDAMREEQQTLNFDHPDSLDTTLMIEHILKLRRGTAVEIPIYDFTTDRRTGKTIKIEPHPIIFVEGILILVEANLRELFDIKIFVDADADIRFIRRLNRDIAERGRSVETVVNQYLGTVRPMHLEFVEPSKRYADVIVPEGGHNRVAIELIAARIRTMLQQYD